VGSEAGLSVHSHTEGGIRSRNFLDYLGGLDEFRPVGKLHPLRLSGDRSPGKHRCPQINRDIEDQEIARGGRTGRRVSRIVLKMRYQGSQFLFVHPRQPQNVSQVDFPHSPQE